jgi:hypothetical protein
MSAKLPLGGLGMALAARLSVVSLWLFQDFGTKESAAYNLLWILVFGFATLNILGLVARRFEPNRNRLSFGETIAILVVVVAVFLLGWEMLYVFGVLPIRLQPHY